MTKYYFDTSAISNLWRVSSGLSHHDLARLFEHLKDPSNLLILSGTLLDELVAAHESGHEDRLAKQVDFLEHCQLGLLRPPGEYIRAEIEGKEPFLSRVDALEALHVVLHRPDVCRAQREELKTLKEQGLRDQMSVVAVFNGVSKANLANDLRDFFKAEDIEAQCIGFMKVHKPDLGLPDDEALWPRAKDIRTLWLYLSVHNSYQLVTLPKFVVGQKAKANDSPDRLHVWFAAFADIFVTRDAGQLGIANLCLPAKTQPMLFRDWASQVLRSPSER